MVVVPDGNVRGTETSWKQFCFVAMHTHAGAHLPADKTYQLMTRSCWWKKMKVDVEWWCDRCWQCLQWRRRPQRSPAGSHVSYTQLPWQDVMVDCEGPSSPPDMATGARYVLTMRCSLCGAVKLEPLVQLEHSHFRRAFMRTVLRTGTFPMIVRSDRGPEFHNAMVDELTALCGMRRIPGAAFRPTS